MKLVKQVLILTPGFPENESDSTCIPALQACVEALHRLYGDRIRLHVIACQYPYTRGSYMWKGISCWSAGGKNNSFPRRLGTWMRVLNHARRLHRAKPFDIVHSFWLTECALTGSWISRLTGARHVAHIMGRDALPGNRYLDFFHFSRALIVGNSPYAAGKLEESYHLRTAAIVPFGINTEDFRSIEPADSSGRNIQLLSVGSLTRVKNVHLFIDLFARLAGYFPAMQAMILGDGPLRDELEDRIRQLNLSERIQLAGSVPRRQVLETMARSKILLHTAPYESAGYIFLEALYSGMQVVAFETGFLPRVPGAWPCKDEEAMVRTLRNLLSGTHKYTRADVPLVEETAAQLFRLYQQDPASPPNH